jgi:hypothetical protein
MRKILLWTLLIIAIAYGGARMYISKRMKGPRWDMLTPDMKLKVLDLLRAAETAGLRVMFWEGWRSVEAEQAEMAKGTSKLKDAYNTRHLWGSAADIVFRDALDMPSWPDIKDPRWAQLIAVGESVGLAHPISWDGPHFELPGFSIKEVRSEYGTNYAAYLRDQGVTV